MNLFTLAPYRIGLYAAAAAAMLMLANDHGDSWRAMLDFSCFTVFVAWTVSEVKDWWLR